MPAETVDVLELSIKTSASQAKRSLDKLATSIGNFGENVSKYVADMDKFSDALAKITESATELGRIRNLGNVIRSAANNASKAAKAHTQIAQAAETAKTVKLEKYAGRTGPKFLPASGPGSVGRERKRFNPETGKYETPGEIVKETVKAVAKETKSANVSGINVTAPWTVNTPTKVFNPATGKYELPTEASKPEANKSAEVPFDSIANGAQHAKELAENARASAAEFMKTVNETDILQMKLDSVGQALGEALDSKDQDPGKVARLAEQYNKLKEKIKEVGDAAKNAGKDGKGLKDVLQAAGSAFGNSGIGKLLGQFGRIAKMRFLRDLAKNMFGDINEGISNLYGWSDKIGGHFAGAMDTIASKAMLAKNSIATAFAPAIEALVPVLSTVVSWIHAASNALAQFIALITGQNSWTEAVETAEDWGGAVKGAGGAAKKTAKEVKDLLADWDELNIIQSKGGDGSGGGGGGGGKAAVDYAKMFKENFKFDEWTRYFEQIKNIAIAIGVAIAGWKLIDMASTFLKKIGLASDTVDTIAANLGKALSGMVLLTISFELAEITGKSVARDGLTLTNALTGIGSLLSGALGGFFLASAINPALGIVGAVGGLVMSLAVGLKAYVDEKRTMLYEDVDAYLETAMNTVFTFDVNAVVEKVNTTVANAAKARQDVEDQLSSVMASVEVLKLGINEGDSWNEIYKQVLGKDGLLEKIKTNLSEDKNVITLYYQTKSKEGLEGKVANGTNVANGMRTELLANDWLANKYEQLGRDFAEKFKEGEIAQIKDGAGEAAMAILETITGAKAAAEKAMKEAELEIELNNNLKALDDETVMGEMSTLFEEYEQKLADARKKAAEEHYTLLKGELAELESLGADETMIESIREQLAKAKEELEKDEFKIDVHAEFAEDEKRMFGEELVRRYGNEIGDLVEAIGGRWLDDANFLNQVKEKGGFDAFVKSLTDDFMRYLPAEARQFMEKNGISVTDFFTRGQQKVVEDARRRSEKELPVQPEVVTEAVTEAKEAVEEAAKAVEESVKQDEAPAIEELSETEKLIADYFKGFQEYWKTGNPAALEAAENKLQLGLIDLNKPELFEMITQAAWEYAGSQSDKSWTDKAEVPSELTSLLTTGINIDAATSGMAMDSTMENVGNALTKNGDETNSLLDKVATRIADLLTATNNLADRPVQVNLGVSSILGDLFGRSSDAYGKATG